MKITIIGLVFFSYMNVCHLPAQKLYVWCPAEQTILPRKGFLANDTINLVVFDGRVISEKSRIECSSDQVIDHLQKFMINSYPSSTFVIKSSETYFTKPESKRITIKIGISAYHAAFGTDVRSGIGGVGGDLSLLVFAEGKWNAITAYSIKIYDYREDKEDKISKDISKTSSKSNIWGYKSAIDCLAKTYSEAIQEMLFFIDDTLM